MVKKVALFGLVIALVVSACGETSEVRDDAEEMSCRSNIRSLATGQAMYYGKYERYASSFSELEQSEMMVNAPDLRCPACDERYDLETDGQTYTISCPCGEHGSIVDGVTSWQNE